MEKYNLLEICDVYQPKTIATKNFVPDGKYTVYGANGAIGRYNQYNHKNGEVIMACRGATCGAINISKPFSWINGNAMVIHPNGQKPILQKYLMYCLEIADKKRIISGTAQPQITRTNLIGFQIPMCGIEEQERIVARIEELFSKLDKAVETLKTTKQQLAIYRQAVLKEALNGHFTNNRSILLHNLGEYIDTPRYGTSKKCNYIKTKTAKAVIRIPNIDSKKGIIDYGDLKFAEFNESELDPLSLRAGDILIIRSNGSASIVGTAAIIRACDTNNIFAGYLMRLRIKDKSTLLPKYLLLYLSSLDARLYIEQTAKSTSGVNNINAQEIAKLPIPVVNIEKQQRIITEIESRLSVYDQIETTIEQSLQQAEAMRQSILKQAFEGDL